MVKIEAIAVDVDGTITDGRRRVCHSALDALRKAEDAGIPVIIATGNISHFAYAVATLVGTTGGLVCENGGVIYQDGYNDNRVIVLGDISKAQKAYDFLLEKFGEDIPFKIVEDSDARVSEICFYKNMDSEPLKDLLQDFDVIVYDSGFALHLTDPKVNKGIGLSELAKLLDYNIENIMCIGDSENDIDFLHAAGFKVAVANACDELKEIADYVCENKYGDGVAEAIDKFVFNEK